MINPPYEKEKFKNKFPSIIIKNLVKNVLKVFKNAKKTEKYKALSIVSKATKKSSLKNWDFNLLILFMKHLKES